MLPTDRSDPNALTGISTPTKIVTLPNTALAPQREDLEREPLGLEPLAADRAVANDAVPASSTRQPLGAPPRRRRVLTHEEEVELARRIESGERDAVFALLGAPASAGAFRALAEEVRTGRTVPSALLRNAEEDADTPAGAERLAKMLDRAP